MPALRPASEDHAGVGAAMLVRRATADQLQPRPRPVTHQYAALAFYTAGSSAMEQRGVWQLRAGDALIVPPGEPHRAVDQQGPEFWGVGFCVPCLPPHVAAHILEPFDRVRAGGAAVVRIPRQRRAHLARLFRELHQQLQSPQASAHAHLHHSLLTLIVHEVTDATHHQTLPHDVPRGLVADSLRLIERQCLGPVSLADIAAGVGRSSAHVTTTVSRATGRSVGQWITAFRMAEARRLLLHGDLTTEDVSARVGYGDVTHFIRVFRREHGETPAAWRRSRRQSADPHGR